MIHCCRPWLDLDSMFGPGLKFIYSEKATKFFKIFPLLLTVCTAVKSKISQNFVAFSDHMNFNIKCKYVPDS